MDGWVICNNNQNKFKKLFRDSGEGNLQISDVSVASIMMYRKFVRSWQTLSHILHFRVKEHKRKRENRDLRQSID